MNDHKQGKIESEDGVCIDIEKLAIALGYEEIKWDSENHCYSGYGSSNLTDRSRDGAGGFYVAANDAELEELSRHNIEQDSRLAKLDQATVLRHKRGFESLLQSCRDLKDTPEMDTLAQMREYLQRVPADLRPAMRKLFDKIKVELQSEAYSGR